MQDSASKNLSLVKHTILILSGKGGVGKSTVATQLALGLQQRGNKVGVLDVDLCGPSIPKMFNLDKHDVHQGPDGWIPVYANKEQTLAIMSIGFLLQEKDDAVVWRGPKKTSMIKQFLQDVCWGELDYLVIDTPPGTSDEHISVVENLRHMKPDGAVLVTTPQAVAIGDVRREITFCKKTGLHVLGIVENMSGFVCPHCAECTNVFSSGGGKALATESGVPFLGCLPLDPNLTSCLETGTSYLENNSHSSTANGIMAIIDLLLRYTKPVVGSSP